jgi:hypothetical protein
MPDCFLDRVDNLSCDEDRGVVRTLTRKARVLWKPASVPNESRSHELLGDTLKYLEGQGIIPMQPLGFVRNREERFAPLVLVKRSPSVAMDDPCCIDVMLRYDHLVDGANQVLQRPTTGLLFGKGRTSIVEKSTNFFYPNGIRDPKDPDKNKTLIVTAHTYPDYETGIAAMPYDKRYPRTIFQGGEINIPYPQSNYHVEGIISTSKPAKLANFIVATINNKTWQWLPRLTWICSECQWEVNDPSDREGGLPKSPTYKMSFEFQHNIDGWDPHVAFTDQRTGRPPADVRIAQFEAEGGPAGVIRMVKHPNNDLEIPAGLWRVPALRRIDFDEFFSALFEGAAPAEMD